MRKKSYIMKKGAAAAGRGPANWGQACERSRGIRGLHAARSVGPEGFARPAAGTRRLLAYFRLPARPEGGRAACGLSRWLGEKAGGERRQRRRAHHRNPPRCVPNGRAVWARALLSPPICERRRPRATCRLRATSICARLFRATMSPPRSRLANDRERNRQRSVRTFRPPGRGSPARRRATRRRSPHAPRVRSPARAWRARRERRQWAD